VSGSFFKCSASFAALGLAGHGDESDRQDRLAPEAAVPGLRHPDELLAVRVLADGGDEPSARLELLGRGAGIFGGAAASKGAFSFQPA
jgi:hypothetical protein